MALYTPAWYAKDRIVRMNETMREYGRSWGESVLWFEYNDQFSTSNDIYDEGPSRVWYDPVALPVLFLAFHQDDPSETDRGLYTLSSASICFQVSEAADRMRLSPLLTEVHFLDRFSYSNVTYRVSRYSKQGFVHGTYLTISVFGVQVKDEEMGNDLQQADYFSQTLVW